MPFFRSRRCSASARRSPPVFMLAILFRGGTTDASAYTVVKRGLLAFHSKCAPTLCQFEQKGLVRVGTGLLGLLLALLGAGETVFGSVRSIGHRASLANSSGSAMGLSAAGAQWLNRLCLL